MEFLQNRRKKPINKAKQGILFTICAFDEGSSVVTPLQSGEGIDENILLGRLFDQEHIASFQTRVDKDLFILRSKIYQPSNISILKATQIIHSTSSTMTMTHIFKVSFALLLLNA